MLIHLLYIAISGVISGVTWIHGGWGRLQLYKRDEKPVGYWVAMTVHFLTATFGALFLWISLLSEN